MTRSIHKSLEFLTETFNEAAVSVLLHGLDSADAEIRQRTILALLARPRGAGQQELIRRWSSLDQRSQLMIGDHPRQVAGAVRKAILSRDPQLCTNGCQALLQIREYALIPALVTAVSDTGNPLAPQVADTLLKISKALYDEINGADKQPRRYDWRRVQEDIIPRLQQAIDRYDKHRRPELVKAFLMLATPDNPLFRQILAEPRHPTYLDLMEILRTSSDTGTMRLILNFLTNRQAPSAVLQVIIRRSDLLFVRQLLKRISNGVGPEMKRNLRRIESISWLQRDLQLIDSLDADEQEATVTLAVASGINRLDAFSVLKYILQYGQSPGRRAASASLNKFGGVEASQLVLAGLEDPDPEVQANMVVQLRERGITGAISRLIKLLDHPAACVRQAAQNSLSEFTFARYLSVFDLMDDSTRHSTGMLVMRIDPDAVRHLAAELKAPVRTRRLRALEVAITMDAVSQVESLVIGLLRDSDHFVRTEAARALAYGNTPLAKESLRQALMDHRAAVRDAAERALQRLTDAGRRTAPSSVTSAIQDIEAESNPMLDGSAASTLYLS